MNVATLHRQLHACGYTKAKIELSEDPLLEDDTIVITDNVHVQVSECDATVVVEGEDSFKFCAPRTTVRALVDDLRRVMG